FPAELETAGAARAAAATARANATTRRFMWRMRLHPVGRLDADQVERARDHASCRAHEAEAEGLRLLAEHAVAVVEAVEVVGEPDRVVGDPLRAAPGRGLAHDRRELGQALDQRPFLRLQRARRGAARLRAAGLAEDPGAARV